MEWGSFVLNLGVIRAGIYYAKLMPRGMRSTRAKLPVPPRSDSVYGTDGWPKTDIARRAAGNSGLHIRVAVGDLRVSKKKSIDIHPLPPSRLRREETPKNSTRYIFRLILGLTTRRNPNPFHGTTQFAYRRNQQK